VVTVAVPSARLIRIRVAPRSSHTVILAAVPAQTFSVSVPGGTPALWGRPGSIGSSVPRRTKNGACSGGRVSACQAPPSCSARLP
jgi:hypothetical protein